MAPISAVVKSPEGSLALQLVGTEAKGVDTIVDELAEWKRCRPSRNQPDSRRLSAELEAQKETAKQAKAALDLGAK